MLKQFGHQGTRNQGPQESLSSVQFSRSVMSDSLRSHRLQHARPPCPSPTPGVDSNSCPMSWQCHPAISSSAVLFSFCLQSFPASGSFPMNWLFASDGQNIGASASASVLPVNASASVLPVNIQGWFPLGLTGLVSFMERKALKSTQMVRSILSLVSKRSAHGHSAFLALWHVLEL